MAIGTQNYDYKNPLEECFTTLSLVRGSFVRVSSSLALLACALSTIMDVEEDAEVVMVVVIFIKKSSWLSSFSLRFSIFFCHENPLVPCMNFVIYGFSAILRVP